MKRNVVLALVLAVILQTVLGSTVRAFDNSYFPLADATIPPNTPSPNKTAVVAGYGKWTNNAFSNLFIYFRTSAGGTITIDNSDFCPRPDRGPNALNDQQDGQNMPNGGRNVVAATAPSGIPTTTYIFSSPNGAFTSSLPGNTFNGTWQWANPTTGSCGQKTVSFSNVPKDPSTGLYAIKLTAGYYNFTNASYQPWTDPNVYAAMNFFMVRANSAAGVTSNPIIAQAGAKGNDGYAVTIQRGEGIDSSPANPNDNKNFTDYSLKFGSDCSVTSDRPNSQIVLYDLDQFDPTGASKVQKARNVELQLLDKAGNNVPFTGIWMTDASGASWTPPSGPVFWMNGVRTIPGNGDQHYLHLAFTAKPGQSYDMRVMAVYQDNTVQYSTPFDGIYWDPPCKPKLAVSTTVNPNNVIEAGTTPTATAQVKNTSGFDSGPFTATWNVWYDGGDKSYNTTNDNPLHSETSTNSLPGGGTTPWPSYTPLIPPPPTAAYFCSEVTLSGVGPNVDITPPGPWKVCVPIAKYPAMQVVGDVRTGGGLNTGSTCQAAVATAGDPLNRVTGHQYQNNPFGQRGSRGSGIVETYGETRFFGSNDNATSNLTSPGAVAADTASKMLHLGSVKWPYPASGYFWGSAPASATPTYCLLDVAKAYAPTAGAPQSSSNVSAPQSYPMQNLKNAVTSTTTANYLRENFTGGGSFKTADFSGDMTLGPNQRLILSLNSSSVVSGNYDPALTKADTIKFSGNVIMDTTASYASISELPLFIVYDGSSPNRVNVSFNGSSVSQFDGLIAVRGNVYTCDDKNGTAAFGTVSSGCNNQLAVNGALVLGRGSLFPYRTAGYDTAVDLTPAEKVTLTPQLYLALLDQANRSTSVVTVEDQKELPPRY